MDNTSLYIIGNGFDLHHGMKTQFSDFQDHLEGNNRDLLDALETYLLHDELWSDFEEALATLDIDTILENASDFLVPYSAEEWSDAYHHNFQYEIDQIVGLLSYKLKEAFTTWVKQVVIPTRYQVSHKILPLNKEALFLNFNYTPTLETLYDIPVSNIVYIHGSIVQDDNDLILGHARNPDTNPPVIEVSNPEDEDPRVLEGNGLIDQYFSQTFKPTGKIIKENESFFDHLVEIQKVHIYGHSLREVDKPYFEAIVKHIDLDKVEWTVSYRSEKKRLEFHDTLISLGVKASSIQFVNLDILSKGTAA